MVNEQLDTDFGDGLQYINIKTEIREIARKYVWVLWISGFPLIFGIFFCIVRLF